MQNFFFSLPLPAVGPPKRDPVSSPISVVDAGAPLSCSFLILSANKKKKREKWEIWHVWGMKKAFSSLSLFFPILLAAPSMCPMRSLDK